MIWFLDVHGHLTLLCFAIRMELLTNWPLLNHKTSISWHLHCYLQWKCPDVLNLPTVLSASLWRSKPNCIAIHRELSSTKAPKVVGADSEFWILSILVFFGTRFQQLRSKLRPANLLALGLLDVIGSCCSFRSSITWAKVFCKNLLAVDWHQVLNQNWTAEESAEVHWKTLLASSKLLYMLFSQAQAVWDWYVTKQATSLWADTKK